MIGHISGKIIEIENDPGQKASITNIIVDVGGVGYEVALPQRVAQTLRTGVVAAFSIYTHLRADGRSESSLELYGFANAWEKKVFSLLTTVQGVGFRTALGIISAIDSETLLMSLVKQDRSLLTGLPGVGRKTAERLLIELPDKAQKLLQIRPRGGAKSVIVGGAAIPAAVPAAQEPEPVVEEEAAEVTHDNAAAHDPDVWVEAQMALTALGYRETDVAMVLREIYNEEKNKDLTVKTFVTKALQKMRTV